MPRTIRAARTTEPRLHEPGFFSARLPRGNALADAIAGLRHVEPVPRRGRRYEGARITADPTPEWIGKLLQERNRSTRRRRRSRGRQETRFGPRTLTIAVSTSSAATSTVSSRIGVWAVEESGLRFTLCLTVTVGVVWARTRRDAKRQASPRTVRAARRGRGFPAREGLSCGARGIPWLLNSALPRSDCRAKKLDLGDRPLTLSTLLR
jgi:hypothetical protein